MEMGLLCHLLYLQDRQTPSVSPVDEKEMGQQILHSGGI